MSACRMYWFKLEPLVPAVSTIVTGASGTLTLYPRASHFSDHVLDVWLGSASTRRTCLPWERNHSVSKTAKVDLPTPPLSPVKTISVPSFIRYLSAERGRRTVSYCIVSHREVSHRQIIDATETGRNVFFIPRWIEKRIVAQCS